MQKNIIDTKHQSAILDISFDYYGKRIATCSADRQVKVFSRQKDGEWKLNSEFTANNGVVFRVKWAHPDFGSILATCSYDKYVIIWEEKKKNTFSWHSDLDDSESIWYERYKFCESKDSIEDIKFAPKAYGLMLSTASADGKLRIYEATDVMNLSSWSLVSDNMVNQNGISCISWSKNEWDQPMIVVGCRDKKTTSNLINGKFGINEGGAESDKNSQNEDNQEKSDNLLCIYQGKQGSQGDPWKKICSLEYKGIFHSKNVNDVAWSELMGRSYHMIASCSSEGTYVWFFKLNEELNVNVFRLETLDLPEDSIVWRISWNLISTVIATNSDDNYLRLWKKTLEQKWVCVREIKEEKDELEDFVQNHETKLNLL